MRRKKVFFGVLLPLLFLLTGVLARITYVCVWGGSPRMESFEEVSAEDEEIAAVAQTYYSGLANPPKRLTLSVYDDRLESVGVGGERDVLPLTEGQKKRGDG